MQIVSFVFIDVKFAEETFANARLWKNLLRRTCTVSLWTGEREGGGFNAFGDSAGHRGLSGMSGYPSPLVLGD